MPPGRAANPPQFTPISFTVNAACELVGADVGREWFRDKADSQRVTDTSF
jgi:hypothetical protein